MIRWEHRGEHVGLAVIDRQERRNALDGGHCDELRSHLERERDLRAIVIAGAGAAFCAGADLGRRAEEQTGGIEPGGIEHGGADSFRPAFDRLLDVIVEHPAPVVAGMNGAALGAGMQLAVACDLRVVAPGATFGIPAAKLGVMLSAANIRRLALLVGHAAARDLLMTGRTIEHDEARALGLVSRTDDDAREGALRLAGELAALAPLTVRGHKRALNLVVGAAELPDAARAEISRLEERCFASGDLREGLEAFSEKRPPRFLGR